MFYLFNVNQGCAQHLEVSAALGTVRNLQQVIEEITDVPAQEQVLLINGGEGLHPDRAVSCYQGCGTESNPVFLFYKFSEGKQRDFDPTEYAEIIKMCQEVNKKLKLYEAASISSALVSRYIESSRSAYQVTESAYQFCSLVFQEHQFLYQGWLALMSNFDECRSQIQKRVEKFFVHYEKMKLMKTKAQTVVQDFDSALELMEKIRIPATLLARSPGLEVGRKIDGECTLYEFIAAADPKNSLRDVVNGVLESIDQMDDSACKEVKMHQEAMQGRFGKPGWQEIGGINGRFQHLDKELRTLEQRTTQMKQISSIISQAGHNPGCPVKDTVAKQRAQIIEVLKILDYVYNTLKSFMGSKQEILHNIRERLSKLALKAYDRLHMLNNAVTVYEEKYLGLRNRLDIIRQVKESPIVYMMAVTETVRRSALQQEFMLWFSKFMEKSQKLVHEEISLRDSFTSKLEHHFLKQLFSGLFDAFPPFAPTQMPVFDQDLPPIDVGYISVLKQELPAYAHLLKVDKPFIYSRLAIGEMQTICSTASASVLQMKDDQFPSSGSPASSKISKHFPSTNWLSGDDNVDLSPSNAVFFVKTPTSQLGSSLEFENTESPSIPLDSRPPTETLFLPQEPNNPTVVNTMKSLPVKIVSQTDPSVKHYEFRSIQRTLPKEALERIKSASKDIKAFAESMQLLQESFRELRCVFDDSVKDALNNVMNGAPNTVEKAVSSLEKAEKNVTTTEDFMSELRDHIGKELSADYEQKMEDEIRRAKEQVEMNCRVHYEVVLEAELKARAEETMRDCEEKMKRQLLLEFSKFEEEIRACASEDKLDDLSLEGVETAPNSEAVHEQVEHKEIVNTASENCGGTMLAAEEREEDESFLSSPGFEAEFQSDFRRWKSTIAKAYLDWHKKVLSRAVRKAEDDIEKKWSERYNKDLTDQIEQKTEQVKKDCAAKYALKLKEEQEKLKEETEKACVMQYKRKFEDDLAKEKEQMEMSFKTEFVEKLQVEIEAAKVEAEKCCSDEYERRLQQKVSELEKEVEARLLQHCKQDLQTKVKEVQDEANEKMLVLKADSARTIESLQQEIQELKTTQKQDEVPVSAPDEKESLAVKSDSEQTCIKPLTVETSPIGTEVVTSGSAPKEPESGKRMEKSIEEMRAALEREYMKKMNLLMKGYEEKKLQEIARIKNEAGSKLRLKDCRIHELEQLAQSLEQNSASQALSTSRTMGDSLMEASACVVSPSRSKDENSSDEAKDYGEGDKDDDGRRSEDDIAALPVITRGAQTRLRARDLRYMIAVQDLHELSTVLVIFSEEHEAYMLFSVNSTLYFVKESCLRRLGLKSDQPTAEMKKNWIIAVITRMEFCQIRKVNNRYNLASGTRFYRVEVEPLFIESSVRRSSDD